MNMVERLRRLGGLRKEEYILLKALILSNSLTINSSSSTNGNQKEDDTDQDESADQNKLKCVRRIESLKESLLSSLYDCVTAIR